ncbi:GNAT family N-acetyltransferase [Nocardioides panacis]|uniref:GNAT family N-acetyltransferase n=1 Tax=Nocardioides panacis TaxID=2849501 RepID=A0A975SV02_9ACTN|nr:GNAT family N-acetyltransferase [Nocardioides panacis]QWZ06341.1 GNAT family N-acetyltransferase [Nocardioides panacis]
MSRLEVLPFDESHLPDAGRLLAARHRRHRAAEPHLPARFEDPVTCSTEVAAVLGGTDVSGAVALRDGRVVGYLLGAPKPGPDWGRNVWVESAGLAVEEAEDARDLYAAAAARWAEEGRTAHYVLVPAHDEALVSAWFRLAFGHQHTHAVREVPAGPAGTPPHVRVRRAARGDVAALARLDLELPAHQALAPTFSAAPTGTYEEALAEWEDDVDDPDFATFVAEHEGRVVGSAVGCRLERSGSHAGPARPDGAGFLGFAAVLPGARGLGAGRALGEAVLDWSRSEGHACVVTDWRATNLLSSRAWPALGFRPSYLRLHRLLGH